MVAPNRLFNYVTSFQQTLVTLMNPIKVYNSFNPNYAKDGQFVVWDFSGIHQDVYTGPQGYLGIDRPIFDIAVYVSKQAGGLNQVLVLTDQIISALHGYQGFLNNSVDVSKIDITVNQHEYDEEASLHVIYLSAQLDIGASQT
jgi:hypothetical protein